ncbi:putative Aldehyde dehydrogenase family [Trypanosoma vivax]|uniref:Aldehyde dehydrogenase n=1 Tax=Trypanosoma vivax (strain Y486) TaxID=1055687 RepID=G0TWX5_TRYVY|nr:putative aldehyde dehydrogenase family [Trypanosoma vivax]KAH8613535.1 putative Aldehyde dehydrogenase family [Trypanosoma vivax]CCC48463.1 putative aldehyde dehydrogenase family [Trypanosoma vivax Y486]
MAALEYTPLIEISKVVERCREKFYADVNRSLQQRKESLRAVLRLVDENTNLLCDAIRRDLRRNANDTLLMEVFPLRQEVWHLLEHLDEYASTVQPKMEGVAALDTCGIVYEPLGVVLIIGTWNYPMLLVLQPLIGALAAGNTVVLKPSELAPATASLLSELLPKYLPRGLVEVVNGAVEETTTLLKERFDHIMYTGNSRVAKIIMTAAAKHLTPVTLELGGKSPVVVDVSCNSDINVVARRIMWGKLLNAGQTCIAPDYVLVESSMQSKLIDALAEARRAMMGDTLLSMITQKNQQYLRECDYPRLINGTHFQRIVRMMEGGKITFGGEMDEASLTIAPTVLVDIQNDHLLMQEEIFGPLLPVIPFKTTADVLKMIKSKEKPLALYVFSNNKHFIGEIQSNTSSGAFVVNDVIVHAGACGLPFGGVGHSGMGAYHGWFSFETFSHRRPVMKRTFAFSSADEFRFPPHSEAKLRVAAALLKPAAEVAGSVGRRLWFVAAAARVVDVGLKYAGYLYNSRDEQAQHPLHNEGS